MATSEAQVSKSFAEVIAGAADSEAAVVKLFAEVIADSSLYTAKRVSGTVQVMGVATAGLTVRAHDQATGALLDSEQTAANGSYQLLCANGGEPVYVVALDAPNYQAQVFDQITPR